MFFNAQHDFTFQYSLLLAPRLRPAVIPSQNVLLQVGVDAPLGERASVGVAHRDGYAIRHAAGAIRLPAHRQPR